MPIKNFVSCACKLNLLEKIIIKYCHKNIRLWIFKATLLLSVFAFSGFSLQAHSAFNQSIKTELVTSRSDKSNYQLKRACKKYYKIPFTNSAQVYNSFNAWALIIYNNTLLSDLKQYKKRTLLFYLNSLKLFFKKTILSSKDNPPLFIS